MTAIDVRTTTASDDANLIAGLNSSLGQDGLATTKTISPRERALERRINELALVFVDIYSGANMLSLLGSAELPELDDLIGSITWTGRNLAEAAGKGLALCDFEGHPLASGGKTSEA